MAHQQARFLTTSEVAEILRVSRATLDGWRHNGRGPDWIKFGGRVVYPADRIDAYIAAQIADADNARRLMHDWQRS